MMFSAHVDIVPDTSVIISLLSNRHDEVERAELYRRHLEGRAAAISFQTEAELQVQRETQRWDEAKLMNHLSNYEIVPLSDELRECYIAIRSEAVRRNKQGKGKLLGPADGWIAAAALMLDCPLVTHDRQLAESPLIEVITELPDVKVNRRPRQPENGDA